MAPAKLSKTNGLIWVTDVRAAISHYSDTLGFEPTYVSERAGEPTLAVVCRDGIELHLQACECEDGRHTGNAFLEIEVAEGIDALSDEFTSAGVEFVRPLTEQDWGRSMKITDPDGNWLMFSQYS